MARDGGLSDANDKNSESIRKRQQQGCLAGRYSSAGWIWRARSDGEGRAEM